jgi:hypothetical protein
LPATTDTAQPSEQTSQEAEQLLSSALESLRNSTDDHTIVSARDQLNRYLDRRRDAIAPLRAEDRKWLAERLGEPVLAEIARINSFEELDTAYLRDALFLYSVARALDRPDEPPLEKVSRYFEWVMRNVQLSPEGREAELAPTDVCLRGSGNRLERAWVFLELIRQSGLHGAMVSLAARQAEDESVWLCGLVIAGEVYLFDPELGVPIPSGNGGIATLRALSERPELIRDFDADGSLTYRVRPQQVKGLRLQLLVEPTMVSPRMAFLEEHLSGTIRANLRLDLPAVWRASEQALAGVAGSAPVAVWLYPQRTRQQLRAEPDRRTAFQQRMALLWMVMPARLDQLRGRHEDAVRTLVQLDMEQISEANTARLRQVPPHIRQMMFALTRQTGPYLLGLSKLEQPQPEPNVAEQWFRGYLSRFGSSTLRSNEVANLAGWCALLRTDAQNAKPSPGRRIWQLLSEPQRKDVQALAETYQKAEQQAKQLSETGKQPASQGFSFTVDAAINERVLTALNYVFASRDLYAAEDFADTPVAEEIKLLLARPAAELSPIDILRRNRGLLLAAYAPVMPQDQWMWVPGAIRQLAVALHLQGKTRDAIQILQQDHPGLSTVHRLSNLALARSWRTGSVK